ncbi:MAG: hypothetical protein KGH71_02535 [Candidatus Micrarchaeota archaeon]|nr:hypothetical protein [Candidatus Micrarchaeota archaeon]
MVVRKTRATDQVSSRAKELITNGAVLGLSLIIIATDLVRGPTPISIAATGTSFLSGYEIFSSVMRDRKKRGGYGGRWRDRDVWEG